MIKYLPLQILTIDGGMEIQSRFISILSTKEIAKLDIFRGYLLDDLALFFLTIDMAWALRNLCPLGVL
tara:strand:+ start:1291 stop:1494 length:204 start_codon:yes stop_codon:yes gene_type:complete